MGLVKREVEVQYRPNDALKEIMVGRMETLVPMGKGPRDEEGHGEPQGNNVAGEEFEEKLNGLRGSMVEVTDTWGTSCKHSRTWCWQCPRRKKKLSQS